MKKIFQIARNTVSEIMAYRLSFFLWRVRMVMQIFVTYFLWSALFREEDRLFNYTKDHMLTYVVGTLFARSLVLSTRVYDIGTLIIQVNLSNLLLKPFGVFTYYLTKDISDKIVNVILSIFEMSIFVFIFHPRLTIQLSPVLLGATFAALIIGVVLYFYFSLIFGLIGFWTNELWAPRFLAFVLLEFFAGGLFPLDILPGWLYQLALTLPFSYFLYFPLSLYLGNIAPSGIMPGLLYGCFLIILLWALANILWRSGLRIYAAEGK